MNEERTEKCLRQVEHIRGHLWHRYSITVNQGTNVSKYFVDNSVFDIYRGLFQLSTNIIGVKARNCNKFDYIAQCTGANKFII